MLNPGSTYTEEFPADAESVPKARAAVAGFALAAGANREQIDAIRLAASEAVTNAVLHAYLGGVGSFQVSASYTPGELWLLVSDDGRGFRTGSVRPGLGVGLVLIAQLSDEFEIIHRSTGGTELQMRFRLPTSGKRAEEPPQSRRTRTASAA